MPVMLAPGLESRELAVSLANDVSQDILQAIEPHHRVDANDFPAFFIKKNQ